MIKQLFLLALTLFLANCASKSLSPATVTDYFWTAQKEQKLDDAKKFVRENDKKNITLKKTIKVKRYTFSDAVIDKDTAIVPTKIYLDGFLSTDKKDQIEIAFNTNLDKTDDGWKVNLAETKKALYIEAAKKFSKSIGSGILGEFKKRVGDFKELQGIFKELVEDMSKSLKK